MFNALAATLVVSLLSMIGVLLFVKKSLLESKYGSILLSLAAGVMLATAVVDLLPEALESGVKPEIFWALLGGICLFFILERVLHSFHHHQHGEHDHLGKPAAYLVLLGDGLHNFFDGIAIAAAFSVGNEVGVATTLAIILHEIPQEIADFATLLYAGFSRKKALLFNLCSAFTAIIGLLLGWQFLETFDGITPFFLAFTAGMFIYIACSDLIPALHENFKKDQKWGQLVGFLVGVVLMTLLVNYLHSSIGHDYHENDDQVERLVLDKLKENKTSLEVERHLESEH